MKRSNVNDLPSEVVIYAFAHIETWLQDYAFSHQLSTHELTQRVAALLSAQAGGQVVGVKYNLPALRSTAAKGNKTTRQVAVAKRAYRKTRRGGPAGYWAKLTRAQRSEEMQRRQALAAKRREAQAA